MKKTTSKELTKRLTQYGALTVAIAGIADANGQVMYTDIADTGGPGTVYQLDLDNNGIIDYVIGNFGASNQILVIAPAVSYIPYTTSAAPYGFQSFNSNAIQGIGSGTYKYPFALNNGVVISSGTPVWVNDADFQTMNWGSCAYSNSQWCGVTDKFLGLRFDIGGNTHYGWARLDVPLAPGGWAIKDFAYEATPGAPITTNATLGNSSKALESIKVVALNKSIGLYNLPETTDYTLYNVAGQKVLDGKINGSTYVVEANSVSSGVYIIEIVDSNTKATLRKKVVL